jgi:hypothetical protein
MILFMGDPWLALAYEVALTSFDQYTLVNTFSVTANFILHAKDAKSLQLEYEGKQLLVPAFSLSRLEADALPVIESLAEHLVTYRAPFIFSPYSAKVGKSAKEASYDIIYAQSPLGQGARALAFGEAMGLSEEVLTSLGRMQSEVDISGGRTVGSLNDERDLFTLFDTEGGPPLEFAKVALDYLMEASAQEDREDRDDASDTRGKAEDNSDDAAQAADAELPPLDAEGEEGADQ